MAEASERILEGLTALAERYAERFEAARTEQELRQARAEALGKKGELTLLLKAMADVPVEQRPAIGERVNRVRGQVEAAFEQRVATLTQAAREAELRARPYDLTLPGRLPVRRGHLHPVLQVRDELLAIFADLGFQAVSGPEVELELNNFTKLAFPPDHPATDMQDTFWVNVGGAEAQRTLLRTHTSNVQAREMSRRQPPMAVVSAGRVYRRDDDVTHSPMFHQIEGFLVDEHVSFAHLKGVLTEFVRRFYGASVGLRFRPSYFPFVEPGAEVDVACVFCESSAGCRVCKGTGWLEVLGCGMVHPRVFEACGIDAERFTGFAFGLGVERVAMLRYGIPDIRLLYENDPRFLAQF